jgi:hypothetical protein
MRLNKLMRAPLPGDTVVATKLSRDPHSILHEA